MTKDKPDPARDLSSRTIHDALFKRLFSDPVHAAAELQAVLPPKVARHIDWASLALAHASVVGKRFRQRHGDLLLNAKLLSGQDIVLWILFEHQSTVDSFMPLRVAEVAVSFWNGWLERHPGASRLPAILPVVLYQGPSPWNAAISLHELIDLPADARDDLRDYLLSCRFVLDDLGATSDAAIAARDLDAYPTLGLILFKHGKSPHLPRHLARFAAQIRAMLATEHGQMLWTILLEYTFSVSPHIDNKSFTRRLGDAVGPEVEQTMMSYAEKLKQEGMQEGMQKGMQEGMQKGMQSGQRKMLLQQLTQRFGPLAKEVKARVANASSAELRRWAMRILDATSLDDVFARR